MNGRTNRDIAHRQGVACFDCSINARLNLVASFQAFRGQDVTAFAIFVQNQRDVRGTVRIVLKTLNNCWDTVFVAFEVNNTISLLVATTDVTSGDTAIVVTTTGFAVFFQQRSKRFALVQLRVNHFNYVATTRRCRFTFNNCHCITPPTYSAPPTKSRFWPSFRVT
ncbi:Uncharacterised protein [Enterobacter cloacae]|nr:Uncharacterised protein [Enterobacter cloacae]SAE54977.1 Uncharacterised protein [Enterobacter cloacae]